MKSLSKKWLRLSIAMMHFWANILLSLIFVLLVLPLGLILRLFFKKALMGHELNHKENSYWIKRNRTIHNIDWAREQ